MKKYVGAFLISLLLPIAAFAQSTPTVTVPDHCTATATDGSSKTYSGSYLGICALVAAKSTGALSDYTLTFDQSFGFFLASLNGITPSSTEFWDLFQDGVEAQVGLSSMTIQDGDTLSFQLTDWSTNTKVGSPITFTVAIPATTPVSSGGGGLTMHNPFSIPLAVSYIWSEENKDGSFGSALLNDWIAIASGGGDMGDIRKHLAAYFAANPPALSSATDYERHAMALEAVGLDPYTAGGHNYIAPIVAAYNGAYIGDPAEVNNDIFAILPLLHAGYSTHDPMIVSLAAHIIGQQGPDGSWNGSADMTAAGIQALALVPDVPGSSDAITKALAYLHTQQDTGDAGFGSSQTTSWVLQAIAATGGNDYQWVQSVYNTPRYYITTKQAIDGGLEPQSTDIQTRIWATAYAIPAMERKSWDDLLASFPKPAPQPLASANAVASTSTLATSTFRTLATSTPAAHTALSQTVTYHVLKSSKATATTSEAATSSDTGTSSIIHAQVAAAGASTDDVTRAAVLVVIALLILFACYVGFAQPFGRS